MLPKCGFPLLRGGEGYTRFGVDERWIYGNWVILEYPPAFRWLRIWSCPFPLPFVLPYVYFFVRLSGPEEGRYSFSKLYVYFGREPLKDKHTQLYTPFMPHFTRDANLCNGKLRAEGSSKLQLAVEIVNRFWNQGFGLYHLRWNSVLKQADWRVQNPYRWMLFSLLTPQMVLELEMQRHGNLQELNYDIDIPLEILLKGMKEVCDDA